MTEQIQDLRQQQDELNTKLAELLLQRLNLSSQIIKLKSKQGLGTKDPQREAEIKEKILSGQSLNPAQKSYLLKVFETILEQSRNIAKDL